MNRDKDAIEMADPLPVPGLDTAQEVTVSDKPAKTGRNWLGWILAIVILLACFWFLDFELMAGAISNLHALEIIVVLFLYSLDRVLMAIKWRMLLCAAGVEMSVWQIIKIYYQGSFTGTFMPSQIGGDLLRAYWVSKESGIKHPVFASLVMERMIGMLSAANWAGLGCVIYFCSVEPTLAWLWILLGSLGALAGNGIFVLTLNRRLHGFMLNLLDRPGGSKIRGLIHKFYVAYADFSGHKMVLFKNILLTLFEHTVQMATIVFIAHSIGIDALNATFVAATALFLFLFRIPVAPDGWGVGELVAIALFVPIGVQAESAFSMTFIGHVLVTLALVPGFFFLFFGSKSISSKQFSNP